MIYAQLLWSFIQIGLFSIGGGYASLPLIEHQVVDVHGWLTPLQLTDIITISQMTPGPIALNAATFVGTRVGGLPGALVATFGCVLLTPLQLTDIITISQMTPGPIALNAATFVGTRVGGLPGALVATFGCVLPSCIIVLALAWVYTKYKNLGILRGILDGLRPAVVALIASAGLTILVSAFFTSGAFSTNLSDVNGVNVVIFAVCLIVLRKWKPDPILVMVGSGVLGGLAVFALQYLN